MQVDIDSQSSVPLLTAVREINTKLDLLSAVPDKVDQAISKIDILFVIYHYLSAKVDPLISENKALSGQVQLA